MSDEKKEAGKKGGAARAAKLSTEKKVEIASRGALARWGAQVTHRGNFKEEFGIDADCYVLNDKAKTAVMSQRGMAAALGLDARSGLSLPRFLNSQRMARYVGGELGQKVQKPLIFQVPGAVLKGGIGAAKIHGYDVTMLIDICKAIVEAEGDGALLKAHERVAKQAHIILSASAKAGIRGLVYALAGYDATREEVIEAFKLYVREEAKKYEAEFPPELYLEWHRLYNIPVFERGRSWHFKHLTVNHIYYPLAKSNGKLLKLLRDLRDNDGDRKKKLFQFLNEVGARALRLQLGRVWQMAHDASDRHAYESKIAANFGDQLELDFNSSEPAPA